MGPWSAFFSGICLNNLLLVAWLAVGLFVGRRRGRKDIEDAVDLNEVTEMMGGLSDWTVDVSQEVSYYNEMVNRTMRWFRQDQAGSSEKLTQAVSLLSQIARANDLLKERLQQAETRLHDQTHELRTFMSEARTDSLTGLPNRRAFNDEVICREAEWNRHQVPFACLMIDIDRFKTINDRFGHAAGDEVLIAVARQLKAALRSTDTVARFGGEEFSLLFSFADFEEVLDVAHRIRRTICQTPIHYQGQSISVTISGGVGQILPHETGKQLLARADKTLYEAKANGRNAICWQDGQRYRSDREFQAQNTTQPPAQNLEISEVSDPIAASFYATCEDLRRQLSEMTQEVTTGSDLGSPCNELTG